MKAYKFVVPSDRFYPLPTAPERAYKGCGCAVLAESEDEARKVVQRYGLEFGLDVGWLEVARAVEGPVDVARVLLFTML